MTCKPKVSPHCWPTASSAQFTTLMTCKPKVSPHCWPTVSAAQGNLLSTSTAGTARHA